MDPFLDLDECAACSIREPVTPHREREMASLGREAELPHGFQGQGVAFETWTIKMAEPQGRSHVLCVV